MPKVSIYVYLKQPPLYTPLTHPVWGEVSGNSICGSIKTIKKKDLKQLAQGWWQFSSTFLKL